MPGTSGPRHLICHVLTVVDGDTEELLDLVELKSFDLSRFRVQFAVSIDDDPEMTERYAIGPGDAEFVQSFVDFPLDFDFRRYAYFIEAARKDV